MKCVYQSMVMVPSSSMTTISSGSVAGILPSFLAEGTLSSTTTPFLGFLASRPLGWSFSSSEPMTSSIERLTAPPFVPFPFSSDAPGVSDLADGFLGISKGVGMVIGVESSGSRLGGKVSKYHNHRTG